MNTGPDGKLYEDIPIPAEWAPYATHEQRQHVARSMFRHMVYVWEHAEELAQEALDSTGSNEPTEKQQALLRAMASDYRVMACGDPSESPTNGESMYQFAKHWCDKLDLDPCMSQDQKDWSN